MDGGDGRLLIASFHRNEDVQVREAAKKFFFSGTKRREGGGGKGEGKFNIMPQKNY